MITNSFGIAYLSLLCLLIILNLTKKTGNLFAPNQKEAPPSSSSSIAPEISNINLNDSSNLWNWRDYKFQDPIVAFKLLNELDSYQSVNDKYFEGSTILQALGSKIQKNQDYCTNARAYFSKNPNFIFEDKNIFSFYDSFYLRKNVTETIGNQFYPNLTSLNIETSPKFELATEINSIFLSSMLPKNFTINKDFACSHQLYNQIPGIAAISRKSFLDQNYKDYKQGYSNKPKCVPKFLPDSFLLANETQCYEFFDYLNSYDYIQEKDTNQLIFVAKVDSLKNKGADIEILDNELEKQMKLFYENGLLCEKIKENIQMQKYIYNPFLIFGHKFDIRAFLLIASTTPTIAYYYDGYARVSLNKFDLSSTQKAIHITGTKQEDEIKVPGISKDDMQRFKTWTFDRLEQYIIHSQAYSNSKWLENSLRFQIKKAMIHTVRMSQGSLLKANNVYQLVALDFILDDSLKLWLLETNTSPIFPSVSNDGGKYIVNMLKDHFEIMFAYLRSRMSRVMVFINKLTLSIKRRSIKDEVENMIFLDYGKIKEEFDKINSNYLEVQFTPNENNGFIKIIDENLNGTDKYSRLIQEDCI